MLRLPSVRVRGRTAWAIAYALEVAAVPDTATALPIGVPLFRSCIDPVGAAALLCVVTVAVTVICVPTVPEDGTPLIAVVVAALVIVTGRTEETLPV
jgi:hypothetical protein